MFDDILHALRKSRIGGLDHGTVDQAGSASNLFAGHFEGVATVADEFTHSRLGIGVMQHLAGEVVSLHGRTWAIPSSGMPREVASSEQIAFGISAHGGLQHHITIPPGTTMANLTPVVDNALKQLFVDHEDVVAAIKIEGTFTDVLLRTVHQPDYEGESLGELIDDEIRFDFPTWKGTLMGFRYPDATSGETIPGIHLHGIDAGYQSGGHVRNLVIKDVTAEIWVDELHVHHNSEHESSNAPIDFDRYEGAVSQSQNVVRPPGLEPGTH